VVTATQADLERKYAGLPAVAEGQADLDAMGLVDDWLLELDEKRLLLNPLWGDWLYFDQVHDSWERTGFRVGEATFSVEGGVIRAIARTPQGAGPRCMTCGEGLSAGVRFCAACGATVPPAGDHLCPGCGTEMQPGGRFCPTCGRAADEGAPVQSFCPQCGANAQSLAKFCPKCGTATGRELPAGR
jgi:hypothetical protein